MLSTAACGILIAVVCSGFTPVVADQTAQPYLGGWDLTIPGGGAGWLGVTEKDGQLKASILWGGGSVVPVTTAKVEDGKLVLTRVQRAGTPPVATTVTIIGEADGDKLGLTLEDPGKDDGRKTAFHRQANSSSAAGARPVESEVRRADRAVQRQRP